MLRIDILRALSGFERLLLFPGLLLLLLAIFHMYSAVYSRAALREFWHNQVISAALAPADSSQRRSGIPDSHLCSTKHIEAYQNSLLTSVPPPLGVLKIPAISLEVPVSEGTDELTLSRGVGHIVTCDLFHFVGNAPLRYIGRASMTDSKDLANQGNRVLWLRSAEAKIRSDARSRTRGV
jgi:hypothetical protein